MSRCKIVAITNQKGGVGKTTTTVSLGVALAKKGKKVLLIDADPQGDLTTCLGYYNQDSLKNTLGSLMANYMADNEIEPQNSILRHSEGIDFIPSNLDLSAIEVSLVNAMSREFTLKKCIEPIKDKYDYILIDCMPSLGIITLNVLAFSDKIIIPVQGEYLAANGMTHLMKVVDKVHRQINPKLEVEGILLTLVDRRTNLANDVKEQLTKSYGNYIRIFKTEIPKAIASSRATSTGKSIFEFDKNSSVATAYEELAKEVLDIEKQKYRNEIAFTR